MLFLKHRNSVNYRFYISVRLSKIPPRLPIGVGFHGVRTLNLIKAKAKAKTKAASPST